MSEYQRDDGYTIHECDGCGCELDGTEAIDGLCDDCSWDDDGSWIDRYELSPG